MREKAENHTHFSLFFLPFIPVERGGVCHSPRGGDLLVLWCGFGDFSTAQHERLKVPIRCCQVCILIFLSVFVTQMAVMCEKTGPELWSWRAIQWGMSLANSWRISGDIYDAFTRPDALCSCDDAKDPHCIAPGRLAQSSMHSPSVLTVWRYSLLRFEHN